jgi:hypothetical protein
VCDHHTDVGLCVCVSLEFRVFLISYHVIDFYETLCKFYAIGGRRRWPSGNVLATGTNIRDLKHGRRKWIFKTR